MVSSDRPLVRVLLVDDNPVDVLVVRRMLAKARNLRFHVTAVDDQAEVVWRLDSGDYAVCLMDRCLGPHDGLDLLDRHVRTSDTTPIIMLTGMDDAASDLAALEKGAADFVPKEEMSPSTLERSIRYALKHRKLQEHLRALAEIDPVTGLRSRMGFDRHLEQAARRSREHGSKLGLIYIDLDRFKPINDRLGHAAGDLVLRHVADCLQRSSPPRTIVARVGGDEFAMLLPNVEGSSALEAICRRAAGTVAAPFELHQETVSVSASFGVAVFPDDAGDLGELVERADQAMYAAKRGQSAAA